jgi:SAM-dependent methyltransferase
MVNKSKEAMLSLPKKLNFGSGKSWKENMFNVDILHERGPDLIFDFSNPFPFDTPLSTRRFGDVSIPRGHFEYILADNVLEHIPDLITAMTNCINLLDVGGVLEVMVPYDLSYGAWQDPTHVRAFNERSWLYYTDWCWYVGWIDYRFDLIEQTYDISEYGSELMQQFNDIGKVARFPRAVDALHVKLKKRTATSEERAHYMTFVSR